jgi:hypothetical protein
MKYRFISKNPKGHYPMRVTDHLSGYYAVLRTNENYKNMKLFANHHGSFVHQGDNYFIHSPYELFSRDSAYHRTVVGHLLIVYLNPQKTNIDDPLKNYEPYRFGVAFMV